MQSSVFHPSIQRTPTAMATWFYPLVQRKLKGCIEDMVSWIKVFMAYLFVPTSHFPHCWRDLAQFKLIIHRTYEQFSSRMWLASDRAFCKSMTTTNLSDCSQINVQLFNFHVSGATAWGKQGNFSHTAGVINSIKIICKSWIEAIAYLWLRVVSSHTAVLAVMDLITSREFSKRRSSSPDTSHSCNISKLCQAVDTLGLFCWIIVLVDTLYLGQ